MNWLTETIITLNPLSLGILLLAGIAVGWTIYGLRGYTYWMRRFTHYQLPLRRGSHAKRATTRPHYGYVEYVPQITNAAPKIKKPLAIKQPAHIIHKTHVPEPSVSSSTKKPAPNNIPVAPINELAPMYSTKDDLQVIEGIGPKIEEILNNNGVYTWRELAGTPESNIKVMLERAGKRFIMHDPKSWPKQAEMANSGQWDDLKEYQDFLHGGRE